MIMSSRSRCAALVLSSTLVLLATPDVSLAQARVNAASSAELRSWQSVSTASEPAVVERYLRAYPRGYFNRPARELLSKLLTNKAGSICERGNPKDGVAMLDRFIPLLTNDPQIYRLRAVCRSKTGDISEAYKDLTTAIQLSPNDADLLYTRGTINLNAGNVTGAFEDLTKAIQIRPSHEPSWGNRCSAALRMMHHQQAVDDCTEALRLAPNDSTDLQNRALAYFNLKKFDLALADVNASAAISTERGDALAMRAILRFHMGQKAEVMEDLEASLIRPVRPGLLIMRAGVLTQLGRTDDALKDLDSVCTLEPGLRLARVERARVKLGRGDYTGAIHDLNTALQLDSNDPESWYMRANAKASLTDGAGYRSDLEEGLRRDYTSSIGLIMRARSFKDAGNFKAALADLDEAVRRSPRDVEALALRGYVRHMLGDGTNGDVDFATAINIDRKASAIYMLQAELHKSAGRVDDALSSYTRAVEADPKNPNSRMQRGTYLLQLGRYEEALSDFNGVRTNPMWQPLADSLRSTALLKLGRQLDALEAADASIRSKPVGLTAYSAYYARGSVRKEVNRCDSAIEDFSKALEVAPDDAAVLKDRAYCYLVAKQAEPALTDIGRVIKLHPKDPGAVMLRGHANWARNDLETAAKDFAEAAALDPTNYLALYNQASALGALKRPAEAVPVASAAIKLDATDSRGFRLRASLYQDLGRTDAALRDYIDAFRLDNDVESLELIGHIYQKRGGMPESLEQMTAEFKVSPKGPTPRLLRARMHLALGNREAAIKDLDEVVRQFPRLSYAYVLRAEAENGLGDQAAYERDLRKVIDLDPHNHSAMNNLAYALIGRPDQLLEARSLILRAMQDVPDNINYLDTRGWIEYLLGNTEDAELYLQQAAVETADDTIHDHLARVLLRRGNPEGAKEHWGMALRALEAQATPNTKRVEEVKRAMDNASKASPSGPARTLAVLIITSDVDCVVGIDNRDVRRVRSQELVRIPEFLGKHAVFAVSVDGLDTWSAEIELTADAAPTLVPLRNTREARLEREKLMLTLSARLPELKKTLDDVNRRATVARAEAAKASENSPVAKRRRADQMRDRLVTYIESLEAVLSWENSEATRLANAAQQADSAGDGSTVGQLVGLIGKTASLKYQSSAATHKERAGRVLDRIDQLTTELGKLSESDDLPDGRVPVPPTTFAVGKKEGNRWVQGQASFSAGTLKWRAEAGPLEVACSDLKSAKRGKDTEFAVDYGKAKVAFSADSAAARDQLIEVWYLGCPSRVAW